MTARKPHDRDGRGFDSLCFNHLCLAKASSALRNYEAEAARRRTRAVNVAVLLVVIKDEVPGNGVVRERLTQLLCDPTGGRVFGRADVEHRATGVMDHGETVRSETS